jgi:hypothetical protein
MDAERGRAGGRARVSRIANLASALNHNSLGLFPALVYVSFCLHTKQTHNAFSSPTIFDTPLFQHQSPHTTTSTQCTFLSHHERTRQYDTDLNPLCISLMCCFFFPHFFFRPLFYFLCSTDREHFAHYFQDSNQPTTRHLIAEP